MLEVKNYDYASNQPFILARRHTCEHLWDNHSIRKVAIVHEVGFFEGEVDQFGKEIDITNRGN